MDKIERINIWFDNAGHYLEVFWISKDGNYFMPTSSERVDVLVDDERNLSGFMVWGVTKVKKGEIVNLALTPDESHPASPTESAVSLPATQIAHTRPVVHTESIVDIKAVTIQVEESGDCIEVRWSEGDGHYAATGDHRVKALTDASGNILGFRITGISQMGDGEKDFINVDLYPASLASEPTSTHS